MNNVEYSYCILKYRHDTVAAEILNVGVVLLSSSTGQFGLIYENRYARLSQAFANFDGEMYKMVLGRLRVAIESFARPLSDNLFQLEERNRIPTASALVREAWPDQGLSYFAGPACYGVTDSLNRELNKLFDRFVLSQFDRRDVHSRFDDDQLWEQFKRVLTPRGILQVLKPVKLGPAEVEFEHAYKNERWHVFEPLSLDYMDGAGMKRRAFEIAGKAAAVRDVEDFDTMTILLGNPRRVDYDRQLTSAKRIIAEAPGKPRIVEESQAEAFANELERNMRAHGVIGRE